jgi:recombination protein RecR
MGRSSTGILHLSYTSSQMSEPEATNPPSQPPRSQSPPGSVYPEPVDRLIAELARLPGIGRRSAERLAFHVLKSEAATAESLARAILDVKHRVRNCRVCFNLSDADRCGICTSPRRDHGLVLVVEQPKDLIALEQTGMFRGVYHVLMGYISPLDGVGPGDLTVAALLDRVDNPLHNSGEPAWGKPPTAIREVIMGLNPTLEGDGTALYLAGELARRGVKVSRLARGLPTGSQIEYANKSVLADAIEGRQGMAEGG